MLNPCVNCACDRVYSAVYLLVESILKIHYKLRGFVVCFIAA